MNKGFITGDRVVVRGTFEKKTLNKIGTVLGQKHPNSVSIEFDEFIYGHACTGSGYKGKDGYCWNVAPEYVELLAPRTEKEEFWNDVRRLL